MKKRKYDVLTNDMGAIHNCKTRIISYVLTWNGIVAKFYNSYTKEIGLTTKIQFIVLKKTLESISYEYRRGGEELINKSLEENALEEKNTDVETEKIVKMEKETP